MADVLHFDTDKALDQFLKVFWEQGYRTTTTKQLAQSASISEGSLFNSFHSKRDIYINALRRYHHKANSARLSDSIIPTSYPRGFPGLAIFWYSIMVVPVAMATSTQLLPMG